MKMRLNGRVLMVGMGVFGLFAGNFRANAQVVNFNWDSTGSGDFDDPTNWSPGAVPEDNPDHYIYWRSDGVTTVDFNQDEASGRTYVTQGTDLTLALDGNTFKTGVFFVQHTSLVNVLNGRIDLQGSLSVATSDDFDNRLTVGAGGIMDIAGHIIVGNGADADGTVEIIGGGSVSQTGNYQLRLGQYTGGTAAALFSIRGRDSVTQAPSSLTTANAAGVGGTHGAQGSPGRLELRDGGTASIGTNLVVWEEGTIDMGADTALSAAHLDTKDGSLLKFEIHHGQDDPWITLSGNATIESGSTLELTLSGGYQFTYGQEFTLIEYGGSLAGAGEFSGWAPGVHSVQGQDFELSYGSGSNDAIVLTAIPEPGALLLTLLGAGALALRRRVLRLR